MAKKTQAQIQYEQRSRDSKVFNGAHEGAGEPYGISWLSAHLEVRNRLQLNGYDASDNTVKAIASLAVRAVFDVLQGEQGAGR